MFGDGDISEAGQFVEELYDSLVFVEDVTFAMGDGIPQQKVLAQLHVKVWFDHV